MSLLEQPVQRIKPDVLPRFNLWVKELCKSLEANSDVFALFRIHISESHKSETLVDIEFLASDEDGAYKNPKLAYDIESGDLFSDKVGKKFNFRNEREVVGALHKFIMHLTEIKYPVSQVYMDVNTVSPIKRAFFRDDPSAEGNKILFMENDDASLLYSYAEAVTDIGCSPELAGSWSNKGKKKG